MSREQQRKREGKGRGRAKVKEFSMKTEWNGEKREKRERGHRAMMTYTRRGEGTCKQKRESKRERMSEEKKNEREGEREKRSGSEIKPVSVDTWSGVIQ